MTAGGSVSYDYETDEQSELPIQGAEPPGPAWLRKWMGDDFVINVTGVSLGSSILAEGGGPSFYLEARRDVRKSSRVGDAELEHVQKLSQIEDLMLCNTRITDAGLIHLKGLVKLRALVLDDTAVTDVGLDHLKGLTHLRELYLQNTGVTDAGVEKLQQALPNSTIHR